MGNELVEVLKEIAAALEDINNELHALRRAVERDRK